MLILANLVAFAIGIAFGWPSPVLPKLSGKVDPDNNPLGRPATHSEESWIAGLAALGGIFGPLIVGVLVDKIGRKRTLLLLVLPMVTSLLAQAFAKTVLIFYITRFLIGVGAGGSLTVLPIYLAEIAETHNRGTLGCLLGIFISLGLLFTFSVGPFLTIRNFCLLCSVPLIIFMVVFSLWIPETPQFLASTNKNRELEITLTKLRNKTPSEIQKEVVEITNAVLEESRNKGNFTDLFKRKGLRKGIIVILGTIILQQFAGINAVLAYMQTIFDAAGNGLAPEISTIIIGVIQTLATVATGFLVERLGRRLLLLASALGSSVSLIALGLFFHLKTNGFNVETVSWLPVASLIAYIVAFNIGLGPLPWAVMAELFPPNVKSAASTITSVVCFTGAFIITLFFPSIALLLGMAKSFWIFAVVCFGGTIFIYYVLPETKGRSLQEIQRLLEGNKT